MARIMKSCQLAVCQLFVGPEKITNINNAIRTINDSVASRKVDVVVLPEIWNSPYATSAFPAYAEIIPGIGQIPDEIESPSTAMLCNLAKLHEVWIVGG